LIEEEEVKREIVEVAIEEFHPAELKP